MIWLVIAIPLFCNGQTPPKAMQIPTRLTSPFGDRTDDYFWLRNRDDKAVLQYLEEENKYTQKQMKATQSLQNTLFEEMRSRVEDEMMTLPFRKNGDYWYIRYEAKAEYPLLCRKRKTIESPEEILLNFPELAQKNSYYDFADADIHTNNNLLAFLVDTVGRYRYTLYFKDLEKNQILPDRLEDVSEFVFSRKENTIYFTRKDPETLRTFQVFRYKIGSQQAPTLVYEEKDNTYDLFLSHSKSEDYIFINSSSTLSDEYWYLATDAENDSVFTCFQPREKGLKYLLEQHGDYFYILTNWQAENYQIMQTHHSKTAKVNWQTVLPHNTHTLIEEIEFFEHYWVVLERYDGLQRLRIKNWQDSTDYLITKDDPTHTFVLLSNVDYHTDWLRLGESSLKEPFTQYDIHLKTGEKKLLKQQFAGVDFDANHYETARVWATAKDGARIPISLVYRKDKFLQNGQNHCLLTGYGAYGANSSTEFNADVLSLLDRGFVYAIAHVRGGQEMGHQWYVQGKMQAKMNTFEDFIACAEYLIAEKYTQSSLLSAYGASAGGLLMGAVLNMRPDLFRSVVADVPFVDVVTTMQDDEIPLTTFEYDEWGNPTQEADYTYMLSYSPYDQVKAQDYPHILVIAGYQDSQVQYWEPAKWVAKLRAYKTDNHTLLLRTYMGAGHGGSSGRYEALRDWAFIYAFLLHF